MLIWKLEVTFVQTKLESALSALKNPPLASKVSFAALQNSLRRAVEDVH